MKKKDKVKGHGFLKFILVLIIICAGTYYYARYVGTTGLVIKEYSVINEKSRKVSMVLRLYSLVIHIME